jgi:hypothetical protein
MGSTNREGQVTYRIAAIPVLSSFLLAQNAVAQNAAPPAETAPRNLSLTQLASQPDFALWLTASVLLVVTLAMILGFVYAVGRESPRIESHWGGFGGGLGGWRISPSLAYLIGAIAFGALFTTVMRDLALSDRTAAPPASSSGADKSRPAPTAAVPPPAAQPSPAPSQPASAAARP